MSAAIATTWLQAVCAQVSLRLNRGLNGGDCPGERALGECPTVYETSVDDDGTGAYFVAEVYLAPGATRPTAATLAEWIEASDGIGPCISHVLHDPANGTRDGVCIDGARNLRALFRAERGDLPAVVRTDPKDHRIDQLRLALREACELLEGWVAWKCPRQWKREHLVKIEALRKIASANPGESPDHDPADGARLNWLEANVNLAIHGHCRVGDAVDEFEVLDPDGDLAGTGLTLRAAIDDARGLPT